MSGDSQLIQKIETAVNLERLTGLASELVSIPSPTGSARAVADRLSDVLEEAGFPVERPEAGFAACPAVVARLPREDSGRILQFNGHLDTVHLPFVPPRIENGVLSGSGAADMKGGVAAMVEAMCILRETELLTDGGILLTAHDLHEAPWGDGSQVDALIDSGFVGDGVLLPEYHSHSIPLVGRGLAILEIRVRRPGTPVHEVLGGIEQPSVIVTGAKIVTRMAEIDRELQSEQHPMGCRSSLFVGQIAAGEIYNQAPTECRLSGTRRWLPGQDAEQIHQELSRSLESMSLTDPCEVSLDFKPVRGAFEISQDDPL
ncbi:MAG: M20/M25/M40 family metallo-hydrolase, partial [Planctomycetaceae bacterium]